MKQLFKIILFSLCLLQLNERQTNAQLYGINPDHDTTVTSQLGGVDSVYVYNAQDSTTIHPKNDLFTRRGALKAVSPDSTTGWKFVWSKFDYTQKIFVDTNSIVLPGSNSMIKDSLVTGGYQVQMIKGTVDTTFRAWVFINQLRLHLRKTADGKVNPFYSQCSFVNLGVMKVNEPAADPDSTYIHNDFYYANPDGIGKINRILKNNPTIKWFPDTLEFSTMDVQTFLYNPPIVKTTFSISFYDNFTLHGKHTTDSVKYDPIRTIADFGIFLFEDSTFLRLQKADPEGAHIRQDSTKSYIAINPDSTGDAPLRVKFKNKSKNGYSFKWSLADKYQSYNNSLGHQTDNILSNDSKDSTNYIYFRPPGYEPEAYMVKLISTGPNNICKDTSIKKVKIHNSQLGLQSQSGSDSLGFPNAFMPESKYNKYFTYKGFGPNDSITNFFSIRNMHLTVFDQWGRLMYDYNGPVNFGWHGWDGYTKWGFKAPTGIYFYVYEALGWGPFNKGQVNAGPGDFVKKGRGFVYLFRKP
jgi:CHU_C Type IX secretion signal domain